MAAMSTKSTEKNEARKGLSPAAVFPVASRGLSPSQIRTRLPTWSETPLPKTLRGSGGRTISGRSAEKTRTSVADLFRSVAVDPVLGGALAEAVDIDQDAEGDEDEAEDEADDEAGRDEVGQEVLLDQRRDHQWLRNSRPDTRPHVPGPQTPHSAEFVENKCGIG